MLARLLAVGDDVDAAILLQLEREHRRVALGVRECRTGGPPGRPQSIGLGEPGGLWQASGDGGRKEGHAGGDLSLRPASSQRTNGGARAAPARPMAVSASVRRNAPGPPN